MKKIIRLNKQSLNNIINESVKRILTEHYDIINNVEYCQDIIKQQWQNPENYWFISIMKRGKDNHNMIVNNNDIVNNYNDILIGYAIVKGNTVEETIQSLLYPTIHYYNNNGIIECPKNQILGNVIELCNQTNARAYFTQRLDNFTKVKNTEYKPNRFTPKYIRDISDLYDDKSEKIKFMYKTIHNKTQKKDIQLVDCDIDDENIALEISNILKDNGIEKVKILPSHNGYHIFFNAQELYKRDIKLKDFNNHINNILLKKYGEQTKNNPYVKIEPSTFSNILLYSAAGRKNK